MNGNKIIFVTLLFFQIELCAENSLAQINFSQFQNQHTFSQASQYMPSFIGEGVRKYKITFFDFYGGVSNSTFSLAAINKLSATAKWSDKTSDSIVNNLKAENTFYAGGNISLLHISLNIKNKSKNKFLSFAGGLRERVDMNALYSRNLVSLLLKGNKQFAGENVSLSPLSVNFLQCTDYFFGMKTLLSLKVGKKTLLKLKPAFQIHYLTSMANVYTENSDFSLYTQEEGRELQMNYNYNLYITSPGENIGLRGIFGQIKTKDITKNLFRCIGHGKSIDIGFGADVNDWIKINMALTDIGSISFKKQSVKYAGGGEIKFDGFITSYTETQNNFKSQADSMLMLLNPTVETAAYKVPLAAKYFSNASFNFLKKRKKNGMVYFRHTFNISYVQGFKYYLNTSKTPLLALGYNYSIGNIVNAGINTSLGGTNGKTTGANLSFQLGNYQLWFNSNNLLPLIDKKNARGLDGAFGMGIEF